MGTPTLWKITCMEDDFPGLWRQWFKHQCVTVGRSPEKDCRMSGGIRIRDWIVARNALRKIQRGDLVIVALPQCRIGRIGKVLDKKIEDDEWDPMVPGDSDWKRGYMGRRISVHWELDCAPDDPDQVIQLPQGENMGRGTLTRLNRHPVNWYRKVVANAANWVGMVGRFGYERALSDYIALYPHRLEDGLLPHPSKENRERVLANRSRLDVLLIDRDEKPVIVESKQDSPTVEAIRQLRGYMRRLQKEMGERVRGILVHGGARTLDPSVRREARKKPRVEVIQYKLDVDFTRSY